MVGYLVLEFTFRNWQDVVLTRKPHIQCGQQEDTHDQIRDQAADDDDGEGTLRVRANGVRQEPQE